MDTLLVLNAAPELEEDLVDYLLQFDCISSFTSYPARGHGRHGHMTIAEQVSGRRRRVQVEILIASADIAQVLSGLSANVGTGISWWHAPIGAHGSIQ